MDTTTVNSLGMYERICICTGTGENVSGLTTAMLNAFNVADNDVRGYIYSCDENLDHYQAEFPSVRVKHNLSEKRFVAWLERIKLQFNQERHVLLFDGGCQSEQLLGTFFQTFLQNTRAFGEISLIVVMPARSVADEASANIIRSCYDRVVFTPAVNPKYLAGAWSDIGRARIQLDQQQTRPRNDDDEYSTESSESSDDENTNHLLLTTRDNSLSVFQFSNEEYNDTGYCSIC